MMSSQEHSDFYIIDYILSIGNNGGCKNPHG